MAAATNGKGRGTKKTNIRYTPEQIDEFSKGYFAECEDEGKKPTIEGLAGFMDITSDTLLSWLNAKSENEKLYDPKVIEILKKAQDRMVDIIQQSSDTMSVFRLKQPRYGGYNDKLIGEGNGNIKVEFYIQGIAPVPTDAK